MNISNFPMECHDVPTVKSKDVEESSVVQIFTTMYNNKKKYFCDTLLQKYFYESFRRYTRSVDVDLKHTRSRSATYGAGLWTDGADARNQLAGACRAHLL
ncbi:hypothetical protein EVAR_8054_1 [Eumeta japonica]|uniref:Uncharacterized protein n=1 Tax=Eumeta variegata TaxID=151549 RepID=A0A4C1TH55_EUMVA|nr:hypothetical protein EVAR_8054_1 [Eumeta japonica]